MGEPQQINIGVSITENDFEMVRKILLDTWNPMQGPDRNKYDVYVEKVVSMAKQGAETVEISFYLNNVELWLMELRKTPEARNEAARAVFDYFLGKNKKQKAYLPVKKEQTENRGVSIPARFQIQGAF